MKVERPTPEEVFPAVGKPTITYVERDEGENERRLASGLRNAGQICLLTGPSKTGKTSLYRTVLPSLKKQSLTIRCSGRLSPGEFWACALEDLDFERLAERSSTWGLSTTGKIGTKGEAGWSWLAKVMATIGFDISATGTYGIKKEFARSSLSAKHLIPLLKELPLQLVVEDFHYLDEMTKKEVFQQWKAFVDEGVSVLVVSTSHHTIDIARSNSDLTGRTRFLDIGRWSDHDLAQIPHKGFGVLGLKCSESLQNQIAKESVGLPIIAQQLCQEIAVNHDLSPGRRRSAGVQREELKKAISFVAENMYANHKGDYEQLITGPRKGQRKYATYEKILASFALEPLQFSLKYYEIIERVAGLCETGGQIPAASLNSALRALGKFQERSKLRLLEWSEDEKILYILEPSFLFYLRQKLDSASGDTLNQKVMSLLRIIERQLSEFGVASDRSSQKRLPLASPDDTTY